MEKPVIISIRGVQSLEPGEEDVMELVTQGVLRQEEGEGFSLSYLESELTGLEGTTTTFTVKGERVELVRTGAVQSKMVFEKGKQDVSLYNVGFGALTIGVKARRLKNELGPTGGHLEISYGIEIGEDVKGLNSFVIDVRQQENALPQ